MTEKQPKKFKEEFEMNFDIRTEWYSNMNRIIKFRAQRSDTKEWIYFTLGDLITCEASTLDKGFDWENWCEFTGLFDKDGKEIYEGDIVGEEEVYHFTERAGWTPSGGEWKIIGEKQKNFTGKGEEKYIAGYRLNTVEWHNTGFEPFCDSLDNCGHCGGGKNPKNLEVIGNVFENPELLPTSK